MSFAAWKKKKAADEAEKVAEKGSKTLKVSSLAAKPFGEDYSGKHSIGNSFREYVPPSAQVENPGKWVIVMP